MQLRMKLKINFSLVLLVFLSGCSTINSLERTIANASESIEQGQMLPISATAEIAGETIQLEVAQTPTQQAIGLMFRESMADDRGMLFPFPIERRASFWMKNVPISLDMIFLNGDRIVGVENNVPPCQSEPCPVYGPDVLVDGVLELRGGRAAELEIKTGDRIEIELLDSLPK